MKGILIYSIISLAILTGMSCWCSREYKQQKRGIEKDIISSFQECLDQDFTTRLQASKLNYYYKIDNKSSSDTLNLTRGVEMGSRKGEIVPYSDYLQQQTPEQKMKMGLQTFLLKFCPISPCTLDSLFSEILREKSIAGRTNVCLTTENDESFCRKSERIDASYYATPSLQVDVLDKVHVQAFVKYTHISVLRRMSVVILVNVIIILLGINGWTWLIRRIRRKRKQARLLEEAELAEEPVVPLRRKDRLGPLGDGTYQIGEAVFVPELGRLRVDTTGKEAYLTRQLSDLLIAFLDAPGHYLRSSEIVEKLWPDNPQSQERQVGKVISKLRRFIIKVIDVEIEKKNVVYLLRLKDDRKKIARMENNSYQVGDYTFNPETNELSYFGFPYTLLPEKAFLLRHFLEASDYYLSDAALTSILFPDIPSETDPGESGVSAAVESLSTIFPKDKDLEFVREDDSGYRLVLKTGASD